ncbi:MAG: response regulator [Bacillota bacterium]
MSVSRADGNQSDVVIVDKCELMRNTIKSMILSHKYDVYEAIDEIGALSLTIRHNPKIIFISMEGNQFWPGLVQCIKKNRNCTIVAYSTGITREIVANAYFAGVDDILVNPQNQKERIEKYITTLENKNPERYYRFPSKKSEGFSSIKKFFWLQAE